MNAVFLLLNYGPSLTGSFQSKASPSIWTLVSSLISKWGQLACLSGAVPCYTVYNRPGLRGHSIPSAWYTSLSPRQRAPWWKGPDLWGTFCCWLSVSLWYSPRVGEHFPIGRNKRCFHESPSTSLSQGGWKKTRAGRTVPRADRILSEPSFILCVWERSPSRTHSWGTELWWPSRRQKHSAQLLLCVQDTF